jgi:hypothetical protein
MANWTWADIRSKIRSTTGRVDASMMSNSTILDYANKFYQFVLPKELKISWGYTYYQFFTQPNIDQYVGPTTEFQTLNPQVWADGWPIEWYLSPDLFYQDYPQQDNKQVVATGDGTTNSFSFTISAYPILAGSLYVTDGTQVAQDNGSGGFVDSTTGSALSGSIDYVTGTVSGLSFTTPPAANTNISATSSTYQPNMPQGILYFQSQSLSDATQAVRDNTKVFVLRPVPDNVYLIKMQGIQIPAPFVSDSDVPFRADLGPLIAYGASLEIFADFNQMDQYDQIMPQYNRYKDVSMQDTYEEYLYQRSVPAF